MPGVAEPTTPAPQSARILRTEPPTPLPDGLIGDFDTSAGQHVLHVSEAEREAMIEPHRVADDFRGKPVSAVAGHAATLPAGGQVDNTPHRHIAAANEGLIVGRPVRHAVLRLIRGMDLRLHPCSVDPAEDHEKCGPNRPTAESSCNNAVQRRDRRFPSLILQPKLKTGQGPLLPRLQAI